MVTSSVFVLRYSHARSTAPIQDNRLSCHPGGVCVGSALAGDQHLFQHPVESIVGLILMGAGLPLYFWFRKDSRLLGSRDSRFAS